MNYFDKAGLLSEISNDLYKEAYESLKEGQVEKCEIYHWLSDMAWQQSLKCIAIANTNGDFPKQVKAL